MDPGSLLGPLDPTPLPGSLFPAPAICAGPAPHPAPSLGAEGEDVPARLLTKFSSEKASPHPKPGCNSREKHRLPERGHCVQIGQGKFLNSFSKACLPSLWTLRPWEGAFKMLFMYRKAFCLQEFNTGPCPSCTVLLTSGHPSFAPLLSPAYWQRKMLAAHGDAAVRFWSGSYLMFILSAYSARSQQKPAPDLPARAGSRKCAAWLILRGDQVKGVSFAFHHHGIFISCFPFSKSLGLERHSVREVMHNLAGGR